MRFVILFVLVLFLISGCATTVGGNSSGELKAQLKQKEAENQALKEQASQLQATLDSLQAQEKTTLKMPSAKEIQTALKNAGFYQGEITGHIGPKTKEAIKKFQAANSLTPDGVVGSRTWAVLSKYL